ncbi:UvrB/UvrC motif-containing protein [bacterium]|nr:UvrB/UvrC motif-containing protein [bacterium]
MKCNICGKNQATIHYSQVINGKTTELHICEACAVEKGLFMSKPFSVADFLAGITDIGMPKSEKKIFEETKCSVCGFTLDNFRKLGRLGCSNCYNTFQKSLRNILKRVHGSEAHVGKHPRSLIVKEKGAKTLAKLKKELKEAIENEEYERAAVIRDEIKKLEGQ